MTNKYTRNFILRRIATGDSMVLAKLSKSPVFGMQASRILGNGWHENRNFANAYATNEKDYPIASLIISKKNNDVVGAVIAQNTGKSLNLSIFAGDEKTFMEIFVFIMKDIRENMGEYTEIYIEPCLKNVTEFMNFLSDVNVTFESRNSEFAISSI